MHTSVRNHSQDVPTTTQVRHRLFPVPQAIDWNPLLRMSTEQTWRDHQSRPTPSCHALDATRAGPHSHWLACALPGRCDAGRCRSRSGASLPVCRRQGDLFRSTVRGCCGSACASSVAGAEIATGDGQVSSDRRGEPEAPALREKRRNATLVTQAHVPNGTGWSALYYKSLTQKLEPVARNVKSHLTDECLAGDKGACSQACPSAQSTGERHELRFLSACAKHCSAIPAVLASQQGAVRGTKPIELAYARRMPKNPVLDNELELLCFRKRASATEALLDSFYVKGLTLSTRHRAQ